MGCWDIFCPFCGLPPRQWSLLDFEDRLLIEKDFYESIKKNPKKYNRFKNTKDLYSKFIKKFKSIENFKKKFNKLEKDTEWLNNCTLLFFDGNIIHNSEEVDCNIGFKNPKSFMDNFIAYPYKYLINQKEVVFLHTECYKYISKKLGYKFSIKHIPYLNIIEFCIFKNINYPTRKYFEQDFDFLNLIIDNDKLLYSPLKNKIVAKNIDKVCSKIKLTKSEIKKRVKRPSPSISANLIESETYSIGNDNFIWQKIGNKWNKVDTIYLLLTINQSIDIPITNLKHYMIPKKNKLKFTPHFILDNTIQKKNRIIKIATTMNNYNKLIKYFKTKKISYTIAIL